MLKIYVGISNTNSNGPDYYEFLFPLWIDQGDHELF
jgi:hypothetical protein